LQNYLFVGKLSSVQTNSEFNRLIRSFNAIIDSASANGPTSPATFARGILPSDDPSIGSNFSAILINTSSHVLSLNLSDFFKNGTTNRCLFKPSYENLDLSANHSSFTSSFNLGIILKT
uniref:Non-specific serine/threonine protein kinase n=1 Tax=Schistosoma curassoni TaxID=6186 RepID=A0A183JDN8_9TREM